MIPCIMAIPNALFFLTHFWLLTRFERILLSFCTYNNLFFKLMHLSGVLLINSQAGGGWENLIFCSDASQLPLLCAIQQIKAAQVFRRDRLF